MTQLTEQLWVGRLLEAAPDAMVCVRGDGRIVLLNAQTERLFGYGRDELAGQPVEILVPDAIKAGHPALRAGYAVHPGPRPMGAGIELSGRRRDGSTFPAEISLSAIDTSGGILVMAAVRDVTERRRAAQAAAWLTTVIQSSHEAVISRNLDGVILSWNPGAERLYGYSAAEMVGHHLEVLIPAGHRTAERKVDEVIAKGESLEQFQAQRIRKNGTLIDVSITLSPIADSTGTIVGISSVSRDVSSQQRADAQFRALLEAAPDAMVCVRGDGRIALLNAQTERLFGYGRDELAGQPVEILVPDAIKAGHPALRAGYAAHPEPRPMGAGIELSGRRRDGSTFPAEISLSAIDTSGGILVMAAVRDVTEQRVLQVRVGQHAADLEWANKNLAAFTYSVAHELRTPLRGLSGFSELLLDEYASCLDETGREYATRIQSASQRMATIIDDLLQLTRVSHADVSLRPFDLSAEVAAIAAELQSREPDRRVRFVIEAGIRVTADRNLIRIVVRSVVENAWKFTALRDAATVEFGTTISDDAEVCYYVRDDGAGFDPAHAGKLFQPFQRLHAASEFPGAGVGLASAQRIIERHGGRIWARGAVDSGATFYFSLNAKDTP